MRSILTRSNQQERYQVLRLLPVDHNLTVLNGYQQGYAWRFDVGQFSSPDMIELAIYLVKGRGYKIGCARMLRFGRKEHDYGVYEPLQPYRKTLSLAKTRNGPTFKG